MILFSGFTSIVFIDQILKYKIRHSGGFYICNNGISFNITFYPIFFWFFFGIFLLISSFYYIYSNNKGLLSPLFRLSFIFIIGGAFSNAIDRLYFGCVTDFLSFKLSFFPFFNPADIAILLGSVLFFLFMFKNNYSRV